MTKINRAALFIIGVLFLMTADTFAASDLDKRIESSAKKSYVFEKYLKKDDIDIDSKDGAVMLKGTVSDESHKALAENTVAALPGVTSVDNQIKVKETKDAEYSDAWISAKIKTALMFHRNVSAANTKITSKDGFITLSGEASSEAQKELTTEYVRGVEGVKDVNNQMIIAQSDTSSERHFQKMPKIDDASITAQVKSALLMHRSTSAFNNDVETRDGVVTITGVANNEAEKDLVSKLIRDIHGVKDVNNEMTVAEQPSQQPFQQQPSHQPMQQPSQPMRQQSY